MALDKDSVQGLLDDFVLQNDGDIDRISKQNPQLYDAVIAALDLLSTKFGTGQTPIAKERIVEEPIIEEEKKEEYGKELVGKKFYHKVSKNPIYEISKVENGIATITWNDPNDGTKIELNEKVSLVLDLFDKGTYIEIKTIEKPKRAKKEPKVKSEEVVEVIEEQGVTEEDILEIIEGLELIADFDDDAKQELKIQKAKLKALKNKKP